VEWEGRLGRVDQAVSEDLWVNIDLGSTIYYTRHQSMTATKAPVPHLSESWLNPHFLINDL
jgi:hypothetical protein